MNKIVDKEPVHLAPAVDFPNAGSAVSRTRLFSDSALYGTATALRYCVGMIVLPVYTRLISQADYACLDLVLAASALVSVILDGQFCQAVNRFYPEHAANGRGALFVGGALTLRVTLSLGVASTLAFLALVFHMGYMPPSRWGEGLWVAAVLNIPVALSVELLMVYARILQLRWVSAGLSALLAATGAALSILLLLITPLGPLAFLVGQLSGNAVIAVCLLFRLRRELEFAWLPLNLLGMAEYSGPLVLVTMLNWSGVYMSRLYVARRVPINEVALLALGMKVLLVMDVVGTGFRTAWEPLSIKVFCQSGGSSAIWYAACFRLQAAGLLLLATMISAGAQPLIALLAPAGYAKAAQLVPCLVLSSAINYASSALNIGNEVARKTWAWTVAATVCAAVTWTLLLTTVGRIGVLAPACGLLAGSMARAVVAFLFAQRHFRVPYEARSLMAAAAGAVGIVGIQLVAYTSAAVALIAPFLFAVCGAAATFYILNSDDWAQVRQIIRSGVRA